jgi:hypothetical protein
MYNFSTFFDKNYLSKGLVLYESLKNNSSENFNFFVLCLDKETENYFETNKKKYVNVITISLDTLENYDTELLSCKNNRSTIAYYFTLSPCLPIFLLESYKLDHICSLDADIFFLSDPKPIFNYLNNYSIIITPHKFSEKLIENEKFGLFNVSFQIFKNNKIGKDCLNLWRLQCIECCDDVLNVEKDTFADQKYLDNWFNIYHENLKILDDNISGLAPWNISKYRFEILNNVFFSQSQKVIFYHFHGFRILNNYLAVPGLSYEVFIASNALKKLHHLYLSEILKQNKIIAVIYNNSIRHTNSNNIIELILNDNFFFIIRNTNFNFNVNVIRIVPLLKNFMLRCYSKLYRK